MPSVNDLPTVEERYPHGTAPGQTDRLRRALMEMGLTEYEVSQIETGRLAPDIARWMVHARAKKAT